MCNTPLMEKPFCLSFRGEIGLGKLQQGLEDLGWRRFKNPSSDNEMKVTCLGGRREFCVMTGRLMQVPASEARDQEQILAIFRCVSVSGHGTLSRSDWNVLQQLTKDARCLVLREALSLARTTSGLRLRFAAHGRADRNVSHISTVGPDTHGYHATGAVWKRPFDAFCVPDATHRCVFDR